MPRIIVSVIPPYPCNQPPSVVCSASARLRVILVQTFATDIYVLVRRIELSDDGEKGSSIKHLYSGKASFNVYHSVKTLQSYSKRKITRELLSILPGYDTRHAIQTSDPQAVMESFKVNMRFILLCIFGYRMCPNCPRCADTDIPCANKFVI